MPITTNHTIHTIEAFLLKTTVFLIPSNLAYHFYFSSAYINGRLSDYLLPKLYLSDIPIIILIAIYLFRNIKKGYSFSNTNKWILALISFLIVKSLTSPNPTSSLWYVVKIIEFYLFGKYLVQKYSQSDVLKLIRYPLIFSIIMQTGLSIYQYINQRSLIGYYFLGEPDLSAIDIAKITANGSLEVIPYGTTAHPNILAGFVAIGLLLLVSSTHFHPGKIYKKAELIMVTGLFSLIMYRTRSLSALSGAIIPIIILEANKVIGSIKVGLLFQITASITLISSLLIYPIFNQLKVETDNPSFYQRYELNVAAVSIFLQNPLSGTGPNLFTQYLPDYPISRQQSYVLQPAHHGLLLILAETGIIGTILILGSLASWIQTSNRTKSSVTVFLPAAGLFIILLLDHYPLTLQTGQLLLTFGLTLPLLKTKI
jgi:hypothetical protein